MLNLEKGEKSHFVQIKGKLPQEKRKKERIVEEWIPKAEGLGRHMDPKKKEWLRKHEKEVIDQSAEILKELIKKGVEHMDIAHENLLVEQGKKGNPHLTLIDFGLSRVTRKGLEKTRMMKPHTRDIKQMTETITRSLARNKKEEREIKRKIGKKIARALEKKIEKEF